MIKYTPMGKRILLEKDELVEKSSGGIILTGQKEYLENKGHILEVGRDVEGLYKGNYILYEAYTGTPIKVSGKNMVLIEEHNVLALLEEENGDS